MCAQTIQPGAIDQLGGRHIAQKVQGMRAVLEIAARRTGLALVQIGLVLAVHLLDIGLHPGRQVGGILREIVRVRSHVLQGAAQKIGCRFALRWRRNVVGQTLIERRMERSRGGCHGGERGDGRFGTKAFLQMKVHGVLCVSMSLRVGHRRLRHHRASAPIRVGGLLRPASGAYK